MKTMIILENGNLKYEYRQLEVMTSLLGYHLYIISASTQSTLLTPHA